MNGASLPGIVEHVVPTSFDATIERLIDAIAGAGLILFSRIDHSAGAHDAGMTMPPSTVLIYGHPKGGTPAMLALPQLALDLPLRVLVREREDGHTVIAFHPAADMLRHAGVPDKLAASLESAQRLLVVALTP